MSEPILADDAPPADPAPAPASAPALLPCPFSGSTDLDDSGDVIKCNTNGAMGPVPGDGQDKYSAWNARAVDAAEPAPDAVPADSAADFKTLSKAREGFTALAEKFNAVLAKYAMQVTATDAFQAELDTARSNFSALAKEKDALESTLTNEREEHAAYKADEPKRLNAQAQRLLEVSGTPAPVTTRVDTNAGANPGAPKSFAHLKGLEKAIAAHSAKSSVASTRN